MKDIWVHRGNIFWVDFNFSTGSEQAGFRPCVIVSNEIANKHSPTVTAVPLTTRQKKPLPTHAIIHATGYTSTALCEQVLSVSKERLQNYIGSCTEQEMRDIDDCLLAQLGLQQNNFKPY